MLTLGQDWARNGTGQSCIFLSRLRSKSNTIPNDESQGLLDLS